MKKQISVVLFLLGLLIASTSLYSCKNKADEMDRNERLLLLDAKIKQNPNDASLYYERGKVLLELEKVNDAISDLTKAVNLDNSKVEYFTALGDAYYMNGNIGESYAALQKALTLDSKNIEALLKMGEISFISKDYDRAMETLSKVTEIEADNIKAYQIKGFIYKETGDTANAIFYFLKIVDLHPDYVPAYEELGMIYAQHKDPLAIEYFNTAIQLQPDNINALYGMAMLYQDLENADKANEYYTRILELDPMNRYAWFNRGYMEMVLYEDYDAAIEFFTKAIDCDNQYYEAHYNRGYSYELKGDRSNARICYQTTLQIAPDYQPAKEALARVQ